MWIHHLRREPKHDDERRKEFFFVSALTGTITYGSDVWLVDSGASRHITGI